MDFPLHKRKSNRIVDYIVDPNPPSFPELRTAKVNAVNTTDDICTLTITGSTTQIPGCRSINPTRINVDYVVNSYVWCLILPGGPPIILGPI